MLQFWWVYTTIRRFLCTVAWVVSTGSCQCTLKSRRYWKSKMLLEIERIAPSPPLPPFLCSVCEAKLGFFFFLNCDARCQHEKNGNGGDRVCSVFSQRIKIHSMLRHVSLLTLLKCFRGDISEARFLYIWHTVTWYYLVSSTTHEHLTFYMPYYHPPSSQDSKTCY